MRDEGRGRPLSSSTVITASQLSTEQISLKFGFICLVYYCLGTMLQLDGSNSGTVRPFLKATLSLGYGIESN